MIPMLASIVLINTGECQKAPDKLGIPLHYSSMATFYILIICVRSQKTCLTIKSNMPDYRKKGA